MPQHLSRNRAPEASDGDSETNNAQEKQESTPLQSLVKITPQEAQAIAQAAKDGTAKGKNLYKTDLKTEIN
jgi:hypothetical protein